MCADSGPACGAQTQKTCSLCAQRQPVTAFYRNGRGYSSQCKACNTWYKAQRYKLNPEPVRAANRRYKARRRQRMGPAQGHAATER